MRDWIRMRGSGGASRPQRQARAGVTYKESDDDDDEFIPNAKLSSDVVGRRSLRSCALEVEDSMITKGRRTLALKRPRIIVSVDPSGTSCDHGKGEYQCR